MIGEALGNYTLTAKLGSGTMGVVFRAEHGRIARTAAIKVLIPELAQNASAVQRFFTEARATSLIRHPGIVDVFDCDVDAAGHAYIVMEHLDGETLAERLRRRERLPWREACEIARQVAEAIAAAHDRGIVHRDLKPENVFLVRDPAAAERVAAVKVLDFGIAKLLAADASARLTMRGMVLGTPEYMAPEQCGGSEAIDERADIYALGCILFEMLSGEPPFMGEAIQELLAAHLYRAAPSIGEQVPGLPVWLADLVTGMLAKQRDDRPPSMRGVAGALGERERAREPAREQARQAAPPRAPSRWGGRAAPVAVAVAGLSALALALWSGGRSGARRAPVRPPEAAASAAAAPAIGLQVPAPPPASVTPPREAAAIAPADVAPVAEGAPA
ncbi:MAG TPA: serine/threonine-protein kinase, partial [Polyangia bacterium]